MEMEIKEKHNGEERKRGFSLFPLPFHFLYYKIRNRVVSEMEVKRNGTFLSSLPSSYNNVMKYNGNVK